MKIIDLFSLATLAIQVRYTWAASDVCSSGVYATLTPLDTYAPATSYCQSQATNKATVTVTSSRTPSAITKRAASTTLPAVATRKSTTTTRTTTTTSRTTTSTTTTTSSTTSPLPSVATRKDPREIQLSSLLRSDPSVVSTFCSCAGFPATTTTTTVTCTANPPGGRCCSDGSTCSDSSALDNYGPGSSAAECTGACEGASNFGQGCVASYIDGSGNCILVYNCCYR